MVRDLRRLADTRFDVLVVGAGIYGAATAWDAAQRGLSVALIDRGDFGGGASFHSLKTLHGGLRSLQAMNLTQMRRFIRERRALARIAPHLVRPLPFVVPTTRGMSRHAMIMRAALTINDLVSRDRNEGIADPDLHLPDGRVVSREEALGLNPFVDPATVAGGAVWYDYQMTNSDRLTLAFVLSAAAAGAATANHVAAERWVRDGGRVIGASARDVQSGNGFDIRAAVVVNAAGAWAPGLAAELPAGGRGVARFGLSRAVNLVVRQPPAPHACGGVVDGRFLFLVPWRGVSILGTSHDVHRGPPDALSVTGADLDGFLADGRRAFPRASLARADVRLVHRGLLPMVSGRGHQVTLLRESLVIDHGALGAPGLVSVHGVRYTTARETAADAVGVVFRELGRGQPPSCRTDRTPLQGGDIARVSGLLAHASRDHADVPASVLERHIRTYGTDYVRPLRCARTRPELAVPLGASCDVTALEIAYAAREEMAVTLADALIRRTEAGSAGHPGADAVGRAADTMAAELGWDSRRRQAEIDAVEAFYRLPE